MILYGDGQHIFGLRQGVYYGSITAPSELTSFSGVLQLDRVGYVRYAKGFNGLSEVWSDGGQGYVSNQDYVGKHCADVRGLNLTANITGVNVTFEILNWYRINSDYNGTANFDAILTTTQPSWTFPEQILKKDILAFGDYSPIYMTWSATYPATATDICVSAKINDATDTMFVYNGETNFS